MTEISTVQIVPQMKVVKIANDGNVGKAYLLNESINDTVVISKENKKGGGILRGLLSFFILPGMGELTDGRIGAGLGFMSAAIGIGAFAHKIIDKNLEFTPQDISTMKEAIKKGGNPIKVGAKAGIKKAINTLKNMPKSNKIALLGTMVAAWGIKLLSGLNAASGKRD